jgi:hypothetical protein
MLLSFSTFAQRKHDTGLVIKAGNFTFSDQKFKSSSSDVGYGIQETKNRPGVSLTFGGYHTLRLGNHFSLSAELLYRYSSYEILIDNKQRYYGQYSLLNYDYLESKQWSESSLSLPVKLNYSLRKNGRTSVSLGGGVSRIIALNRNEAQQYVNLANPRIGFASNIWERDTKWQNFENMLSLTAGITHRISDNTRIGFEFTFEKVREVLPDYAYQFSYLDCICDYFKSRITTPKLQNVAVSLYHNLLR